MSVKFFEFSNESELFLNVIGKAQKGSKLNIQVKFESVLELKISNFGKILLEREVAKVANF